MPRHLPTFFMIGGAKGGTTSLWRYLDEHPDIYMSSLKDPNFFCLDAPWKQWFPAVAATPEAYSALFADAGPAKAVGEASVSYLVHPPTPGRIREAVPDAKLIAILREPANRAYAEFVYMRSHGMARPRSFREAVEAELRGDPDATIPFVRYGYYAEHLGRYLSCFSPSQLRVHLFDDLVADPRALMRDVYQFLEVDPDFQPTLEAHNTAQPPPRSETVARFVRGRSPLKTAARALVPSGARGRLRAAVERRNTDEVPAFDPEVHARLKKLYRDDVARLQDLLGRDLSKWLE